MSSEAPIQPPIEPTPRPEESAARGWFRLQAMRYPSAYVWIVFFSALDVILTKIILIYGDTPGELSTNLEINPIARLVIEHWTMTGATAFKFAIALLVIIICEVVGRARDKTGRRLAWTCVGLSAFPVVWSLTLLFINRLEFFEQPISPDASERYDGLVNMPRTPSGLPDFDAIWDFNDPAETQGIFEHILASEHLDAEPDYRVQVQTQIARALGLQGNFDAAHALLDQVAPEAADLSATTRVRHALERGRVFNSSGSPDQAMPLFFDAYETAHAAGLDVFAVDAAHMLAIVSQPDEAITWNQRALEIAQASDDPRARRWDAALLNNLGWAYHDKGEYEIALDHFERALAIREQRNSERATRDARWAVARAMRSLGRYEDALAIQRKVLQAAEDAKHPTGYEHEEIAENLLALNRLGEARPHFMLAYEQLSQDPWLMENEPARLERLKAIGEGRQDR